jgi:poly(3-hydroxybutyrate) depolymerase
MNQHPRHLGLRRSTTDDNDDWKCGEPTKRQLVMEDCISDCERNYVLYLPQSQAACDISKEDTLPLVFAVHCLGCTPDVMMHWTEVADEFSFVLVIPEGLERSFNGQNCCGYALENNVNDVGFLQAIIQELSHEFPFLSSEMAYAMGWSNGGYLVSYAARLFRAIAPISGYQVDLTDVDRPTAVFLHHAADDHYVRITGCCTDPTMPRCCCRLSTYADQCTSVEDKSLEWSSQINGCPADATAQTTLARTDVTCYTYPSCQANTTYCIHQNKGHFNQPSFRTAFPMTTEIADFFARDACKGSWSPGQRTCTCPTGYQGAYCRTAIAVQDTLVDKSAVKQTIDDPPVDNVTEQSGMLLAIAVVLIAVGLAVYYFKSPRKRYKGFGKVPTVEMQSM